MWTPRPTHRLVGATALAVVVLAALGPLAAQPGYDVVVDAGETVGVIPNLFGVTCGPQGPVAGWYDLTPEYNWLRVQSVRVHDCSEVGDVNKVFPSFNADPTRAKNYDFANIDRYVQAIVVGGMSPCYRLGYSWNPKKNWTPASYDQFAEICRHIVMHYTQGWANGFHFKNLEWEIWNEANLRQSWSSTAQNFYKFYQKVVAAVRRADPTARVGTCGLAVNWPRDYQEGLIAYCAQNQVPLDFYSWHYYGWGFDQAEPYDYARQGQWIRSLLDAHGFQKADVYVTEWGVWLPGSDPRLRNLDGAVYCLSCMMYMVDGRIDMAHHYRGDLCGTKCGGLFVLAGEKAVPILRAHAFYMLGLLQDTPNRLAATGVDRSGFAVLAGRSADGTSVQVLVSDFWSRIPGRKLRVENLRPARRLLQIYGLGQTGFNLQGLKFLEPGAPVVHVLPPKAPYARLLRLTETGPGDTALVAEAASTWVGKPAGRFRLVAVGHAGEAYLVLGGVSGSRPGTRLGPNLVLPLNLDLFTFWLASKYNRSGYSQLVGVLDPFGTATVDWQFDPFDPAARGTRITFAAALLKGAQVSNVTNAATVILR